jgi:hypothetical protein
MNLSKKKSAVILAAFVFFCAAGETRAAKLGIFNKMVKGIPP